MKRMVAKYRGVCHVCGEVVHAGSMINFHGRGHVEHPECALEATAKAAEFEDERAGLEYGTLAADRSLARRGVTVVRFGSGESMTMNTRGRCEDAPCCGCCS